MEEIREGTSDIEMVDSMNDLWGISFKHKL